MDCRSVIACNADWKRALGHESLVCGPAAFGVVMRTVAPCEKAQSAYRCKGSGHRVSNAAFKPAERARARAAKRDSPLPRLAQDRLELPVTPYGEHAPRIPASDVNHVELEDMPPKVRTRSLEEAENVERDPKARICLKKTVDLSAVVAARRRHETHTRSFFAADVEDIAFDLLIAARRIEDAATDGNDVTIDHGRAGNAPLRTACA